MTDRRTSYDSSVADTERILEEAQVIAVVGASTNPSKPAGHIPEELKDRGFTIWPVNPNDNEVLGERAFPDLSALPGTPDVVQVFRPAEEAPSIAQGAVAAGAKVLWLQAGLRSDEARAVAEGSGLEYIEDLCMGAESRRLNIRKHPQQESAG